MRRVLVLCQIEPYQHKASSVHACNQKLPIRSTCDWLDVLKTSERAIKYIKYTYFWIFKDRPDATNMNAVMRNIAERTIICSPLSPSTLTLLEF